MEPKRGMRSRLVARRRIVANFVVSVVLWLGMAMVYFVATGDSRLAQGLAIGTSVGVIAALIDNLNSVHRGPSPGIRLSSQSFAQVVALMNYSLVLWIASSTKPSVAFIQLCAQVLPVLLLGVGIQMRFFQLRQFTDATLSGMANALVLVVIILGEGVALATVYSGQIRNPYVATVPASIAASLTVLALGFLWLDAHELEGRNQAPESPADSHSESE